MTAASTPEAPLIEDSPLLRFLKWANSHLIRLSMARTRMLLLFTGVLFAGAVVLLSRLGTDFLPAFDEGSVQVNLTLPPGFQRQQ